MGFAALSGSRAQHLQRRSGIFHLRIRVPDDLRSLVGLTEVRRSLHTYQSSRARLLAAVCAAHVFEAFEMMRTKELSKEQVRGLIGNLFEVMKREVEGATRSRLSEWDLNEQLYCSSEITVSAQSQRALGKYERAVQLIAQRALTPSRLKVAELSPTSREDLMDGAARALVERERLYQLRLSDRLAPFVPSDPIFLEPSGNIPAPAEAEIGPTLGEAVDTYLATKQRSWTAKTYAIRTRYLSYCESACNVDPGGA